MKDETKLFVYLASFYLYGGIVSLLGLQEVFSGNIGALPVALVVSGVTIALVPGCRVQTNPRKRLPSDRLAAVLGGVAVGAAVLVPAVLAAG
jgi:hypothetical protein